VAFTLTGTPAGAAPSGSVANISYTPAATGNLILLYVLNSNNGTLPGTPLARQGTTTLGNFQLVDSKAGTGFCAAIYAILAPAGMDNVNLSWGFGSFGYMYAEEWSGNAPGTTGSGLNLIPNCIDTHASINGTSANKTSGISGISPTNSNSLLVGLAAQTGTNGGLGSPAWNGTPSLTSGSGTLSNQIFTGYLASTSQASAAPVGNWVTSRAWVEVTAYFKPAVTVTKQQQINADISRTPTSQQQIGAYLSNPSAKTKTQQINADIKRSNLFTQPIGGYIGTPPFSPLILMGSGNNIDQAQGSIYFELSGDLDGGGPATGIGVAGTPTGALLTYSIIIDGGEATT
jgi:hypothetical protein